VNCPRDVFPADFEEMMYEAHKEGRVMLRSKRRLWWRDFTFLFNREQKRRGEKLGDTIVYSLACKFNARRA
jgi:ligand-binding sensor domain-containing protein